MDTLFLGATNLERAHPLFERVGFGAFMKGLEYANEEDGKAEIAGWFDRPFVKWSPPVKVEPGDWKFEALVHNTGPESYSRILRNPFGILNAFYSIGSDGFGHAESGDGFYVFGKAPAYAAYGDNRIYFRALRPPGDAELRRGSALKDEAMVLYGSNLRIIPETFPTTPAAMAEAYFHPETFADPGNPGKLAALQRRMDRNWTPELERALDREIPMPPDGLIYYLRLKKGPQWARLKKLIEGKIIDKTLSDDELYHLLMNKHWMQAPEMKKWVKAIAQDQVWFTRLAKNLGAGGIPLMTGNFFSRKLLELGEKSLATQALKAAMTVTRLRANMVEEIFSQESSVAAKSIFSQHVKAALKERSTLPMQNILGSVYSKPHSVAFEEHWPNIIEFAKRADDSRLNEFLLDAIYLGPDPARRLQIPEIREFVSSERFRKQLSPRARGRLHELENPQLACPKAFGSLKAELR